MAPAAKGNPFVHMELNTPDVAKAKAFYSDMFGWAIEDQDMGGGMMYSTFKPADGPGGGMMSMPGGFNGWMNYVGVEEINAATEKAKSLGAEVVMGPHPIPNVGFFTILKDPTGCVIAIFQPTAEYAAR